MKLLSLLPVGALVASAACAPKMDMASEVASLRRADSAYSAAAQSKSLDAFLSLYADDAVMYPPNEPTVTGIEAVRQYIGNVVSSGFAATFTPVDVQVAPGGGMGYTLNNAHVTITDTKGASVAEDLRDFHVWRKGADGTWKLVIDIWNSPTPLPAPAPAPTRR